MPECHHFLITIQQLWGILTEYPECTMEHARKLEEIALLRSSHLDKTGSIKLIQYHK